ncbi:MAG TPA: SDR family NAD(P)-dependent oxidoreductase [Gemmatimonadales bacterium]|nr:SDR family NAD(P)-dependent oxidoreductase [Gemmatimonadales bacterium]
MSTLAGQVALVTGSSRGIGEAIARRFAAEGAAVAVHGRDEAAVRSVRGRIESAGGRAIAVLGDVTSFADLEGIRARGEAELGPIDVLVANAGGSPIRPGPMEEITEEGWRASVDVNLTATFLTIKSVLPGMKARRRGIIITMSSFSGRRPHARSPVAYAAAKAGIEMLTRVLALQAGPHGIRVNGIAPETILTEKNLGWIEPRLREHLAEEHPLRRLGTPDDVAGVAAFLASSDSAWMTGVIVDVTGGA